MLIRFEVANHRSIRESVELSMVAIDRDREAARPAPMLGESLLPVAAIYGPNASGKSNVLSALAWLSSAVQESVRFWEGGIPVDPFAGGGEEGAQSDFAIEFLIEGVRFEYLLEVTPDHVVYEGLFHYPEKKRRRLFEREGEKLTLQRGLGSLSGVRQLLTGRTLALSAAYRFGEPLVSHFVQQLAGFRALGDIPIWQASSLTAGIFSSVEPTRTLFLVGAKSRSHFVNFEDHEAERDRALALLRLADLGIEDVVSDMVETISETGERQSQLRTRLIHKMAASSMPLDFAAESAGTKAWFTLSGPALAALNQGSVLLVDELDASLHPMLSAELVRLFQSPTTNPKGAQLIFTSHDTSLLNHLNRDEVWLTEKRPDGSTRLGALADFAGERVRKSQNLENAYLHGRFGALPQIDQTELRHSPKLSS